MLGNNTVSSGGASLNFKKGMLFGIIIFMAAFPILFYNETRSLAHYQASKKDIVSISEQSKILSEEAEPEKSRILLWIFRLVGFFLMFFGLAIILKMPFKLPIIGHFTEIGVGIVAFLISTSLCFLTISAAWLLVRPILSAALIAVAIAIAASMKLLPKHQAD